MESFFPDFKTIYEVKKDAVHVISHNLLCNSWQESSPRLKGTKPVSQGKSKRTRRLHPESSWYRSTVIVKELVLLQLHLLPWDIVYTDGLKTIYILATLNFIFLAQTSLL